MPRRENKPDKPVAYDAKGRPIFGYNGKGQPVCFSRKRKQPDTVRCMRTQRMDNGRCKDDGGKSLSGAASATAKPGLKFSNLFPARLKVQLAAATEANAGVDLSAELVYCDIREAELISSLNNTESRETIKAINEEFQLAYRALQEQSWDQMNSSMVKLGAIIQTGAQDSVIWKELFSVVEKRVKIAREVTRQKTADASMLHAAMILDLNLKAINILRAAVELNVSARFENMLADIRIALASSDLDTETSDRILGLITPIIARESDKTQDSILDDASKGVKSLLPAAFLLPDGNLKPVIEVEANAA